jgi:hypothetical protein
MPFDDNSFIHRPEGEHHEGEQPADEAIRLLIETKRILVERGWCPNSFADSLGRHCIIGALCEVKEQNKPARDEALLRLQNSLFGSGFSGVIDFNDSQNNIKPILALLDKAIALRWGEAA